MNPPDRYSMLSARCRRSPLRLALFLCAVASALPSAGPASAADAGTPPTAAPEPETRPEALDRARSALRRTEQGDDRAAILRATLDVARAANDVRELATAEEHATRALALARSLGDRHGEARALQSRGATFLYRNEPAEAVRWFARAAAIFDELGDHRALGRALRNLGMAHRYANQYATALETYQRALAASERAGDASEIGEIQNGRGVVLAKLGRFEEALAAHQASLAVSRELDQPDGIATSLYNLGDVYSRLGDHDLARRYLEDALEMDRRIGNPGDIAFSANRTGEAWLEAGDLERARQLVEEAAGLFRSIDAPRDAAWAESNLGRIALAEGDIAAAGRWLRAALTVAVEREDGGLEARIRAGLAEVALRSGDPQTALREIERAIAGAHAVDEPERRLRFYELRTQILEAQGDLPAALVSAREEGALQKEIFDTSRATVIAGMQGRIESVRREQELEILRRDRALAGERLARERVERNVLLGGITAGFVLLLLAYGRFAQRRSNRRLRAQVEERTRDLVAANQALEELGWRDPLTGARNRRFLDDRLPRLLARARTAHGRSGNETTGADLVLFLVDLDRFKRINDVHGHHTGDRVLRDAAEVLRGVLRPNDILVRWGGEEFLLVEVGGDRSSAPALAERLRRTVEAHPFVTERGEPLSLTTSVGFAPYPLLRNDPGAASFDDVLGLADDCLYRAKEAGRNGWVGVLDDPQRRRATLGRPTLAEAAGEPGPLRLATSSGAGPARAVARR